MEGMAMPGNIRLGRGTGTGKAMESYGTLTRRLGKLRMACKGNAIRIG